MFDLTNKIALVTGASGGIGREISKTLSQLGAKVALSGTRIEKLEETAKLCPNATFIAPANLSDPASITDMIDKITKEFGPIDILVNNAGVTKDNLSMRMSDEEWNDVINVNLTSTFKLCKAVIRGMMKNRYGRIINITSVVGHSGNPGQANYVAAKAGITGLSKSLALEVASRGITINCVAPGFIATDMTDKLTEDQKEKILSQIPSQRMGNPDEIASAVAFLASSEASYITGNTIHVNGGMYMV